jgi:transposase
LTDDQKALLVEKVQSKELTTSRTIASYCTKTLNTPVSHQTIIRVLHQAGLKSYRTIAKAPLTEERKRIRLEFATKYADWNEEDWKQVIFSDETRVSTYPLNDNERVWAEPTEDFKHDLVVPRVHSEGVGITVWACISTFGLHDVVSTEETMNSDMYVGILNKNLLPVIKEYFPDGNVVFQQDNAPIHNADVTITFLNDNDITTFDWPPYSPDLNPIENFWAYFKKKLSGLEQSHNKDDLWRNVKTVTKELWNEETTDMIKRYYKGMPKRLAAVIKANGGYTKY